MREPVLLIEENSIDALAIRRAFSRLDNPPELKIYRTAMEALDYLGSQDARIPKLIIHDLNVGKMNGHTFLKTIRSDERLAHVPVVIVTTSSKHRDFVSCFEFSHVIGYFVKPVDYFELVKGIVEGQQKKKGMFKIHKKNDLRRSHLSI